MQLNSRLHSLVIDKKGMLGQVNTCHIPIHGYKIDHASVAKIPLNIHIFDHIDLLDFCR